MSFDNKISKIPNLKGLKDLKFWRLRKTQNSGIQRTCDSKSYNFYSFLILLKIL